MLEQGTKFKKILSSKITLFLLLLGFIWLVVNLVNVYYKKYKINKEIEDLKQQITQTEKSNQQISAMIDYLSSQNFLEKEAREKLNMKKPGEQVVIVEPSKNTPTSSESALSQRAAPNEQTAAISEPESNLMKWWKYFFK